MYRYPNPIALCNRDGIPGKTLGLQVGAEASVKQSHGRAGAHLIALRLHSNQWLAEGQLAVSMRVQGWLRRAACPPLVERASRRGDVLVKAEQQTTSYRT